MRHFHLNSFCKTSKINSGTFCGFSSPQAFIGTKRIDENKYKWYQVWKRSENKTLVNTPRFYLRTNSTKRKKTRKITLRRCSH